MTSDELPFDPIKNPIVGHFGGVVSGIAVQEPYLYAGFGPEFAVLDISDPELIVRIGYLVLDGVIHDIQITDEYAFVTIQEGLDGLYILDITRPELPVQIGFYPQYNAYDVVITQDVAYLIADDNHIYVIDVHEPVQPVLISKFRINKTDARWWPSTSALAIEGRYAYVAMEDLYILDITDPFVPHEVAKYPIDRNAGVTAICVQEPFAYLATGYSGLLILDVSDPTKPNFISSFGSSETFGAIDDVVVVGRYAYLQTFFDFEPGYFQILDILSIQQPKIVYQERHYPFSLFTNGRYAYLIEQRGLRVLDIADPVVPIEVGQYLIPGNTDSLALANQIAYISGGWFDLHIVNVSQPDHPIGLGYFCSTNYINRVIVVEPYVYLVEGVATFDSCSGGLRILEVSNPSQPIEVGYWGQDGGWAEDVLIIKNIACLRWAKMGRTDLDKLQYSVRLLDISNPSHIKEFESHRLSKKGLKLKVDGRQVQIPSPSSKNRSAGEAASGIIYFPVERRGLYICRS